MIARAQKTSLVLRIVGEKSAALANIEDIGKHVAEAREGSLISIPLAVGNHEIGIAGAILRHQSGCAVGRFLSEPGIFRNLGHDWRRVGFHPQSVAVEVPAVRRELRGISSSSAAARSGSSPALPEL